VLDLKVDARVKGSQLKEPLMEKDHETHITQGGRAERKRRTETESNYLSA
jgi:hypothetical protein